MATPLKTLSFFLFPLAMTVSCDHSLIDGVSGTQVERVEPPVASSSTLLPGKQILKQAMEIQKDETSLERQHCHWGKKKKPAQGPDKQVELSPEFT